jgi:hypothetical protein
MAFFSELISNPVSLFLFVLVIIHMSILTYRSYLEDRRNRANLREVQKELRLSEIRVKTTLERMDAHRDKMIAELQAISEDMARSAQARNDSKRNDLT